MSNFKELLSAVFERIQLIEELCLMAQSLPNPNTSFHTLSSKNKLMIAKQTQLIEKLIITKRAIDTNLNMEFQLFSESVFRHWESSFTGNCIGKGRMNEIIELYFRFFGFIEEREVISYLNQMIMNSKSENSVMYILLNCTFRVLRQLTDKTIVSISLKLKGETRVKNRLMIYSKQRNRAIIDHTIIPIPKLSRQPIPKRYKLNSEQSEDKRPLSVRQSVEKRIKQSRNPSLNHFLGNSFMSYSKILALEEQNPFRYRESSVRKGRTESTIDFQEMMGTLMSKNQIPNSSINNYKKQFVTHSKSRTSRTPMPVRSHRK